MTFFKREYLNEYNLSLSMPYSLGNLESIPYCLSHRMQQSNEYLVCCAMSKTAKIDENIKITFLSRLNTMIPSHIAILISSFNRVFYALSNEHFMSYIAQETSI